MSTRKCLIIYVVFISCCQAHMYNVNVFELYTDLYADVFRIIIRKFKSIIIIKQYNNKNILFSNYIHMYVVFCV